MNDQVILDNYLLVLKSTVEVFVHGTLESSNDEIKSLLQDSLNETLNSQSRTYKEMVNRGWYQVENVDKSTIQNTLTKVENN